MNNNRILFARGNTGRLILKTSNDEKVMYGQPIYSNDKNYLTVGNSTNKTYKTLKPIDVRRVIGWFADNSTMTASMADNDKYSIEPDSAGLKISSAKDIYIIKDANNQLKIGTGDSAFTGTLKVDELKAKNIQGDANINIIANGSYTIDNNRILNQLKNIVFKNSSKVRSKLIITGEEGDNDSVTVDKTASSFLVNTSTTELRGNTVIGTDPAGPTNTLVVNGGLTTSGYSIMPYIRTVVTANVSKIILDHNGGNPQFTIYNGTNIAAQLTKTAATFNKPVTATSGITVSGGGVTSDAITTPTLNVSGTASVTGTLTVATLNIK